jgi:hypothetical protein
MTRRTLIKRAAIIGGVAWATPVILSTPAFAAGGSVQIHACCACSGCGDANICNEDHTSSLPQLANEDACKAFCLGPPNNCATSSYLQNTTGFLCTAGPGKGVTTCTPVVP